MAHTIVDFWQMVWHQRCPIIVMITKLKEKSKVWGITFCVRNNSDCFHSVVNIDYRHEMEGGRERKRHAHIHARMHNFLPDFFSWSNDIILVYCLLFYRDMFTKNLFHSNFYSVVRNLYLKRYLLHKDLCTVHKC